MAFILSFRSVFIGLIPITRQSMEDHRELSGELQIYIYAVLVDCSIVLFIFCYG